MVCNSSGYFYSFGGDITLNALTLIVDAIVQGFHFIVNVIDWIGATFITVKFLGDIFPVFGFILNAGLSVIAIKFILKGGK